MKTTERIYTRCPACQNDTLTINDGHLLCTWIDCKNPTLIDNLPPLLVNHGMAATPDASEIAAVSDRWFMAMTKLNPVYESNEWKALVPQVAKLHLEEMQKRFVWYSYIHELWLKKNVAAETALKHSLEVLKTVRDMDAILTEESGEPVEARWAAAVEEMNEEIANLEFLTKKTP